MERVRAYLELARLSNLPTVWANVLHGFAAAVYVAGVSYDQQPPAELGFYLNQAFMLLVAMSMLYVGGMILNDVCDAKIDATERPNRPIPSGRVCRHRAGVVAGLMLLGGVVATGVYACVAIPIFSIFLAVCIVLYNVLHHRFWLAGYLLMPVCRAMVILIPGSMYAALVQTEAWRWHVGGAAIVLAFYTAMISLIARHEAKPSNKHRMYIVVGLIAAMPLVDAAFLFAIGMHSIAWFCVGCAAATAVGQWWVKGT